MPDIQNLTFVSNGRPLPTGPDILEPMSDQDLLLVYQDLKDSHYVPKPNTLMIVGTGGMDIWERAWAHLVHSPERTGEIPPADEPGSIRAMCMAKDATKRSNVRIWAMRTQFYTLTPEGKAQEEMFLQGLEKSGFELPNGEEEWRKDQRDRNPQSLAYMERHPDNGFERFELLASQAKDTHEAATHLLYLALLWNIPSMVTKSRELARLAASQILAQVTDPRQDEEALREITAQDTLDMKALAHVNKVVSTARPYYDQNHWIVQHFVAKAEAARHAAQARNRNMNRLAELGAKNGGIPSEARHLSDDIFHGRIFGPYQRITEALYHGAQNEVRDAFRHMEATEANLVALPYGWMKKREEEGTDQDLFPERNAFTRAVFHHDPHNQLNQLIRKALDHSDWTEFYDRAAQHPQTDDTF